MSYDVIILYPFVPINKAFNFLIDQLNNNKDDLIKRTKVCLKYIIYKLAELCQSKYYFLWNNEISILRNSRPIGLSFLAALSKSHNPNLEYKANAEKLILNLAPKSYRRYGDDTQ